jgi:hypothetical protein
LNIFKDADDATMIMLAEYCRDKCPSNIKQDGVGKEVDGVGLFELPAVLAGNIGCKKLR